MRLRAPAADAPEDSTARTGRFAELAGDSRRRRIQSVIASIAMGDGGRHAKSLGSEGGGRHTGPGGGFLVVVGIIATVGASVAGFILKRKNRKRDTDGVQHPQDSVAAEAKVQSRGLDLATLQLPIDSSVGSGPQTQVPCRDGGPPRTTAAAEQVAAAGTAKNLFVQAGEEKDAMFGVNRAAYATGQIRPDGFDHSEAPESPATGDTQVRQVKPEDAHVQETAPGLDNVVQDTRKGDIFMKDLDSKDKLFGADRRSDHDTGDITRCAPDEGDANEGARNPFVEAKDEKDAFFGVTHTEYEAGQIQPEGFKSLKMPHTRTGSDVTPRHVKPKDVVVQETAPGVDKLVQDTRTGDVFATDLDSKDRFFGVHGEFPTKGRVGTQGVASASETSNTLLRDKDSKDAFFGVKRPDYANAQVVPGGFDASVPAAGPAAESDVKPLGPGEVQQVHDVAAGDPQVVQNISGPFLTQHLDSKDKFFGVHGKWPQADSTAKAGTADEPVSRGFPAQKQAQTVKEMTKVNSTAVSTRKVTFATEVAISEIADSPAIPLKLRGPIARLMSEVEQGPKSTETAVSVPKKEAPVKDSPKDAATDRGSGTKAGPLGLTGPLARLMSEVEQGPKSAEAAVSGPKKEALAKDSPKDAGIGGVSGTNAGPLGLTGPIARLMSEVEQGRKGAEAAVVSDPRKETFVKDRPKDVGTGGVLGTKAGPIARLLPQAKQQAKDTAGSDSSRVFEAAVVPGSKEEALKKEAPKDVGTGAIVGNNDGVLVHLTLSTAGEKFAVELRPADNTQRQGPRALAVPVKDELKTTIADGVAVTKVASAAFEKAVKPTGHVPEQVAPTKDEIKTPTVPISAGTPAGVNPPQKPSAALTSTEAVQEAVPPAKTVQDTSAQGASAPLVVSASSMPVDNGVGPRHNGLKPIAEEPRAKADAQKGVLASSGAGEPAHASPTSTGQDQRGDGQGGIPQPKETLPEHNPATPGIGHQGGQHHHGRHHHHHHHHHGRHGRGRNEGGGRHGGRGGQRHRGRKRS